MILTTLKRVILMSLTSFIRNSWLSLTGVLVMTITLSIISFFYLLTTTVNKTADTLKDKIDIAVYLNDEVSSDQIVDLKKLLQNRTDVKDVIYVSKEEAAKRFSDLQHFDQSINEVFTESENPFPRSLEIKPSTAENTAKLFSYLKDPSFAPLIKKISYEENKVIIDRLISITSLFTRAGIITSLLFVLISFLIIFNTIKLTIFSRRDEIEIMRLVGATDIFVKVPLILEGVLYGVLATVISSFILYSGISLILPAINNYLGDINIGLNDLIGANFKIIIIGQLIVGVILGSLCSLWATRRYVK